MLRLLHAEPTNIVVVVVVVVLVVVRVVVAVSGVEVEDVVVEGERVVVEGVEVELLDVVAHQLHGGDAVHTSLLAMYSQPSAGTA